MKKSSQLKFKLQNSPKIKFILLFIQSIKKIILRLILSQILKNSNMLYLKKTWFLLIIAIALLKINFIFIGHKNGP